MYIVNLHKIFNSKFYKKISDVKYSQCTVIEAPLPNNLRYGDYHVSRKLSWLFQCFLQTRKCTTFTICNAMQVQISSITWWSLDPELTQNWAKLVLDELTLNGSDGWGWIGSVNVTYLVIVLVCMQCLELGRGIFAIILHIYVHT